MTLISFSYKYFKVFLFEEQKSFYEFFDILAHFCCEVGETN